MPDLKRLGALRRVLTSLTTEPPYALAEASETLPYAGPVGHAQRLADVYVPDEASGVSVLLIHGGGFVLGSRDMKPVRVLATDLVAAGVTVCAIDYRKPPHGRVPDMRDDAVLALFWWLEEMQRRGLDTERFDLMGLSAGGCLASLANEVAPKGAVRQMVLGFPLLDIEALKGIGISVLARGLFPGGDRARWSPIRQCRSTTPVIIHQGTADQLVTEEAVTNVVRVMRERGTDVTLHRYDGAPHGIFNEPDVEWAVLARERVVAEVAR